MNQHNNFTAIVRVAVPSPLRCYFDYLPPENLVAEGEIAPHLSSLRFGMRVLVPFGNKREVVGFVVEMINSSDSEVAPSKLKRIIQILDNAPLWSPQLLALLKWVSVYYHSSLGEVLHQVLPPKMRKKEKVSLRKKGKKKGDFAAVALLAEEGALSLPELNVKQREAVEAILREDKFSVFLLDGITGSGKTEVYLRVIAQLLAAGKQALVLVPEINLTPQTVARFTQRFLQVQVAVIHSKLTAIERVQNWRAVQSGAARIIIGTRSAIFTPLAQPGIIIIDEEHDQSFKQQSLLRYSARDTAIMRGKLENIPVVLGSATPSLESFANATREATARYTHLTLPERAGNALHPKFHVIDMRAQKVIDGLAAGLIQAIERHLDNNGQILLFINARGYAPILLCNSCGWMADCKNCDAHLTLHRATQKLHCHHCGAMFVLPQKCGQCGKESLHALGMGTEKLESLLPRLFPGVTSVRIDSDTTSEKGALDKMLASIHSGESRILIGTQMLAKGHHFPDVTLATVLNVDNALFSSDFRASEHLAQLIVQVAGRAGRAERPGEVYIQTHHPQHPLLQRLVQHGYHSFAWAALRERAEAKLPPFSYLALLRAEAKDKRQALEFLTQVKEEGMCVLRGDKRMAEALHILGPTAAPMERRAGFYQAQLLFQGCDRAMLQKLLVFIVKHIEGMKAARALRWSLDVDPVDMG